MKKTTHLRELIEPFGRVLGVDPLRFCFLFDDSRIYLENTPGDVSDTQEIGFLFLSHNTDFRIFHQLGMQDDDEIDANVRFPCSFVPPSLSVYVACVFSLSKAAFSSCVAHAAVVGGRRSTATAAARAEMR